MIGADATIAALAAMKAAFAAHAQQALGQSAAFAAQQARSTTTFKDRTGRLRSSIQRNTKGEWRYTVTAGGKAARYGYFVENGTSAHAIVPKRPGGVLRFWVNGDIRFARRVRHPGTTATHFMLNARNEAEGRLISIIESGARSAVG